MSKDLGVVYDYPEPCCEAQSKKEKPKKHYPSVRIETDERLDIPEEGTVTFTFSKKSGEWHEKDDGKKRYECRLELRTIVRAHKGQKPKADKKLPSEDTENALDSIAAEMK